ncbi:MAG TPA: hypothetical protein VEM13_11005 [Gemmatimonadales bacterium]|nr:hypothetical protein [Gemmatimonadales bacterium]
MAVFRPRPWRGLAVAAALVAAACNDSTGPQAHLSDPQGLNADAQTVAGVLQSPAFQSFSALTFATGSPVGAPSRAGALLRAAPIVPPRASTQLYTAAPQRLEALRLAASTFSSGISASVIPGTLLGKTFVWDEATHQYVEDPSATPTAPANGVRIILYQVDAFGQVIEPPVAVGFVDLLDESTTSPPVDKLHIIVKDGTPSAPGTTYADYTVSATVTGDPPTAFTATAAGSVSDGTRTLTFSATFAATQLDTDNPDYQIDIVWDLDNPVVHVELHETITSSSPDDATLSINFSVTRGGETVSVEGTITEVLSTGAFTVSITIQVDGVPYARITGDQNVIRARHADGSELSQEERLALATVLIVYAESETAIFGLFTPAGSLMGA